MRIDLTKTLRSIEKALSGGSQIDLHSLEKAYEQTLRLRSQLLSVLYDRMDFSTTADVTCHEKASVSPTTEPKRIVTLKIPEPLPARRELTAAVEEHWVRIIHDAIAQENRTGIPRFQKAFVLIVIETPRGTNNRQAWDTSNRAINVIINNLKGIFFDDDNFEHMSFSVEAGWGEMGMTEVRICSYDELKKCGIFR